MSLDEQLLKVQSELKAPKGQKNSFGKYMYRNCEDILEAVKPLLLKHGCTLIITDDIKLIGDRYYVNATVMFSYKDVSIRVSAFAREALSKKGMDESQITGAASSYARKYALNGLFLIDDTKDADSQEPVKEVKRPKPAEKKAKTVEQMIDQVFKNPSEDQVDKLLNYLYAEEVPTKTMDYFEKLNKPFQESLSTLNDAVKNAL